VDDAAIAALDTQQAEQAGEERAPVVKVSPVLPESKEALLAAGLKRCSKHLTYLDRLPAAAKQLTSGRADVSIRKLTEFGKSSSASDGLQSMCKACDHIAMRDARVKAAGGTGTQREKIEATIARKDAQVQQLIADIAALQAQLAAMPAEAPVEAPTEA
jgi:hypothetical protein